MVCRIPSHLVTAILLKTISSWRPYSLTLPRAFQAQVAPQSDARQQSSTERRRQAELGEKRLQVLLYNRDMKYLRGIVFLRTYIICTMLELEWELRPLRVEVDRLTLTNWSHKYVIRSLYLLLLITAFSMGIELQWSVNQCPHVFMYICTTIIMSNISSYLDSVDRD